MPNRRTTTGQHASRSSSARTSKAVRIAHRAARRNASALRNLADK